MFKRYKNKLKRQALSEVYDDIKSLVDRPQKTEVLKIINTKLMRLELK